MKGTAPRILNPQRTTPFFLGCSRNHSGGKGVPHQMVAIGVGEEHPRKARRC